MRALTAYKWLTLFGVGLLILQGLLFLVQAATVHQVMIGPKMVKAIIFIMLSAAFLVLLIARPHVRRGGLLLIYLYTLFLFFNLTILVKNNPGGVWALAFLYNYSLTIMAFPLAILALTNEDTKLSLKPGDPGLKVIHVTVASITAVTLYEVATQHNIFQAWATILSQGEIIKFGQIGGLIRPSSIFKSPIDYSYFNAIVSGLMLLLFLRTRSMTYLSLFAILSACQVLIMVRSGLVAYLAIVALLFLLESNWKDKVASIMAGIPVISVLFISLYDYLLDTVLNPTNLYIRLNNWSGLLSKIWGEYNILLGPGIVQNGNYGDRNSVVIDNLYIGIVYTGGIIGLTLFLFVIILTYTIIHRSNDMLRSWQSASLTGFLFAGFFENTMHLMYIFILPLLFTMNVRRHPKINKNRSILRLPQKKCDLEHSEPA